MKDRQRRRRGTGCIQKRGDIYWLYHNRRGKQQGESLHTTNRQEAEGLARRRLKEIDYEVAVEASIYNRPLPAYNTTVIDEPLDADWDDDDVVRLQRQMNADANRFNPTLDEFWKVGSTPNADTGLYVDWAKRGHHEQNTFLSHRTSWRQLRMLFPSHTRLGDFTQQDLHQYENVTKGRVQPSTMALYMVQLNTLFTLAIKEGWLRGENPVNLKRVKYHKRRSREVEFLTEEQVEKIISAAKDLNRDVYLFVAIAAHTGMRKSEIANLRWEDFKSSLTNSRGDSTPIVMVQSKSENKSLGILGFKTKSKHSRSIPLKKELIDILEEYKETSGYVLSPDVEINRQRYNISYMFGILQKNTGIKIHPHLLRHTFGSLAAISGVSIFKISKWMGHTDVKTTVDFYAHLQAHDADIDRF